MIDVIPHSGGREAWRRARKFAHLGFKVLLWRNFRGSAAYVTPEGIEPYGAGRTHANDAALLARAGELRRARRFGEARMVVNRLRYARGAVTA